MPSFRRCVVDDPLVRLVRDVEVDVVDCRARIRSEELLGGGDEDRAWRTCRPRGRSSAEMHLLCDGFARSTGLREPPGRDRESPSALAVGAELEAEEAAVRNAARARQRRRRPRRGRKSSGHASW